MAKQKQAVGKPLAKPVFKFTPPKALVKACDQILTLSRDLPETVQHTLEKISLKLERTVKRGARRAFILARREAAKQARAKRDVQRTAVLEQRIAKLQARIDAAKKLA